MTTRLLSRLAAIATLCLIAAAMSACQNHQATDEAAAADASTRPIPDKGPKRPADLTPPPPPNPGHTAR